MAEVSSYVAALEHGLRHTIEGFPVSLRLIREMHGFLEFFLTGVAETSNQTVQTSQVISGLFKRNQVKITTLKRAAIMAMQVHKQLQRKAIANASNMASTLEVSVPTARAALNSLKDLGIVKEIKGSGKKKLCIYTELIDFLELGAILISLK